MEEREKHRLSLEKIQQGLRDTLVIQKEEYFLQNWSQWSHTARNLYSFLPLNTQEL